MERNTSFRGLAREVATSVAASSVFGIAAGLGSGTDAMLRGAWAAPALFVGGVALAVPPLYVAHSLGGAATTPQRIVQAARTSLARVTTVLLGLAAPVAFFSVTLRSSLARALLVAVVVVMGTAGVVLLGRATAPERAGDLTQPARLGWYLFAFALGARLMFTIARSAGLTGGA